MKTELFTLASKDFAKGLVTAVLTAILTGLYTSVQAGQLPTDMASWKVIGLSGLGAGIAYLTKNWLTNSKDQILTPESPKNAA